LRKVPNETLEKSSKYSSIVSVLPLDSPICLATCPSQFYSVWGGRRKQGCLRLFVKRGFRDSRATIEGVWGGVDVARTFSGMSG